MPATDFGTGPRNRFIGVVFYGNGEKAIKAMNQRTIRNIKRAKAILGLITAAFSLALAIQQVYQLKKGQTAQA